MAFLELKGVEKFFGEQRAIKGIDLTIEEREMLCIVGPSGAGKSTLLHLLGTLDLPSEGKIVYDGPADGLTAEVLTDIYGEEDWSATIQKDEGAAAEEEPAKPAAAEILPPDERLAGLT